MVGFCLQGNKYCIVSHGRLVCHRRSVCKGDTIVQITQEEENYLFLRRKIPWWRFGLLKRIARANSHFDLLGRTYEVYHNV